MPSTAAADSPPMLTETENESSCQGIMQCQLCGSIQNGPLDSANRTVRQKQIWWRSRRCVKCLFRDPWSVAVAWHELAKYPPSSGRLPVLETEFVSDPYEGSCSTNICKVFKGSPSSSNSEGCTVPHHGLMRWLIGHARSGAQGFTARVLQYRVLGVPN